MPKVFFTSDTHFGHQRTFDYSKRSMYFKDVDDMNEEMIHRWNSVVNEEDTIFHLGDFGDFEIAKRLNGTINLLYGNYERKEEFAPTPSQKKYFNCIFEDLVVHISNSNDIIQLTNYIVVHEPENKKDLDIFYLFGHIHEKQKVKRNGLNVGVDVHNFTPVSEETIEFYRNSIENIYDENCFKNY